MKSYSRISFNFVNLDMHFTSTLMQSSVHVACNPFQMKLIYFFKISKTLRYYYAEITKFIVKNFRLYMQIRTLKRNSQLLFISTLIDEN